MSQLKSAICGNCRAEIRYPLPSRCPECHTKISGVRQSNWMSILSLLSIVFMFALLAGTLWWLSQK